MMTVRWRSVFAWLVVLVPVLAQETYDWSKAAELVPGIRHTSAVVELPNAVGLNGPYLRDFDPEKPRPIRMQVARIDTRQPGLRFTATGRAEGWGEPIPGIPEDKSGPFLIRTERQTTRQFAQAERTAGRPVVLAINTAPWSPFGGTPTPYADRMGLAVSGGLLISPANGRPSLVVRADGSVDLVTTTAETDLAGIQVAASGFQFCLVKGEPVAPDKVLHPRTGIGLCAEKRFLVFLVVDGRQADTHGVTVREVGEWLRHYGASDGLNMDGGGSTTMVLWNPDRDAYGVANKPSGGERKNGSNLGVFFAREPAAE
ncbi:MAG: phosphodiester glycosidase family protein [Lentisphaeria bacterium]|jgi:hypothetical protein|nr:phosphodiester glycosidase family protein [Lentisphaeria bacterium]